MKTTTMRAALIAGTYLGLAGAWIMGSGWLARSIASSVEELERLERWKGMGFVLVTGLGLFFVAWSALRKQHADAEDAARAREALLKSERKAMAGLFVSSIAHDASNLTFVVTSALELLNRDPELSQDDRACVEDASAAMSQLITLFKDLKQMGGNRNPSLRVQIDLGEAARRAVKLLKGHSLMKHARVVVDAPTKIDLLAFPVLIDQLLINLLLNAADATGGRGHLEVRLRSDEKEARLERLVVNLLDMSRLQSGVLPVKREWVPLEELVGSALGSIEARLEPRTVKVSLPTDLPLIAVDPVLFEQVLRNLLDNVVKYTPPTAPVELSARAGEGVVELTVDDGGPGLQKRVEGTLFEKFARGDHPGTQGAGLGLAVARGIIEVHGGRLTASRSPLGGARFTISLPRTHEAPAVPEEKAS